MGEIIAAATVAFIVSVVLSYSLRPVAFSLQLVDHPGGRKIHTGDIPIVGGMAMFGGIFAGLVLVPMPTAILLNFFVATSILLIVGVVDDRFHIPARLRLVSQIAVALIMIYGAGLSLVDIGDPFGTGVISLGSFSIVVTMLVTLTVINAYNLVDGLDGLAGSLAFVGLSSIALIGGTEKVASVTSFVVCGAILGFLVFNFPSPRTRPLRTFMGDSGSTVLGFTVAWIGLSVSQGDERLISPVYCLWFAAIPIYDCLTCFVRRLMQRKSPFIGGRDHFHHLLLRGGFDVRQALGVLTALQTLYVLLGIAGHIAEVPEAAMFATWSMLGLAQRYIVSRISLRHRGGRIRNLRRKKTLQNLREA